MTSTDRPSEHLEHVVRDLGRSDRLGFPEVVFGEGKRAETIAALVERHEHEQRDLLITRLGAEKVPNRLLASAYDPVARTLALKFSAAPAISALVAVVAAGTSDAPVAREAVNTLDFLGVPHCFYIDVGVAGLHRLLAHRDAIAQADVIIAVAGFEAALASVMGGLFPQPIIGVPTSVGYGVASGGQVALGAMLASCANGIAVMNIDNGYGAALAAVRMMRLKRHGG
jgi:NCAIR mutase (PurE)-related protein